MSNRFLRQNINKANAEERGYKDIVESSYLIRSSFNMQSLNLYPLYFLSFIEDERILCPYGPCIASSGEKK